MRAYYNEIDPFASEWLRELIKDGHIADGDVDCRSIEDVIPSDLKTYTQCHFFAGIGVWSYALRQAGWPDDRPVWTGSCPCQPFSSAGKGAGFADERHLWPAFHWLIAQCRPVTVFGEQVASKDGLAWLGLVSADMEGEGYAIGAVDTCAAGFGAPHIRQRLYWVADSQSKFEHRECGEHEVAGHKERVERGGGGAARGMAHAPSQQKHKEQCRSAEDEGRRCADGISGCGLAGGVADAEGGGRREKQQDDGRRDAGTGEGETLLLAGDSSHNRSGPTSGFWRDADWLLCRDGKWRPAQSEIQPLAHGATNRVGILRGAGNAIVAPQAIEIIKSYIEGDICGNVEM